MQTKSKGMGKRYFMQVEGGEKAGGAILVFSNVSDKTDFKTKDTT